MRKSIKRFTAAGAAAALISGGMLAGAGTAFADEPADGGLPDIDSIFLEFLCEADVVGSIELCDDEGDDAGDENGDETADESGDETAV
ncbi:hypothetical protein [Hoyosella altamirensis]|uniref:Secreted protein n=1 Tax=Hoyosella altamirensis TaxID=616997 RepID=A0A839RHS3_9ACTN|nr:hypothetical protein [Hoyosella altamirensis]MBB3035788.1 hypothetical protein [Hoyosella altamirensis]